MHDQRHTTAEHIRVVIADDEPLARRMVAELLADEHDFAIVAECANGPATIEAVRNHAPDVLFLDVRMPGASGIEVLDVIGADAVDAVVLITAFDDYALDGFEHQALDYVLKPIAEDRFRGTVERIRERIALRRAAILLDRSLHALAAAHDRDRSSRFLSRFLVRTTGRITIVDVDDVDWIRAAGDYLELHSSTRLHLLRGSLSELDARLDPRRFVRIHRSVIVRIDRVSRIEPALHGDLVLTLHDGTHLRLSRTYRDRFETALGQQL